MTSIASGPTPDAAAEAVLAACNKVAAAGPTGSLRIHGGVVARCDRAVVICGTSGAGKSTLTAALAQRGWTYLTDEIAVVDPHAFTVTPYPKWVDLSAESLDLLDVDPARSIGPTGAKHHVPPGGLGSVGVEPTRVSAIVVLDRNAPEHRARRLEPREAVEVMLGHVFATTWDDPGGLQALVRSSAGTPPSCSSPGPTSPRCPSRSTPSAEIRVYRRTASSARSRSRPLASTPTAPNAGSTTSMC